MSSFPKFFFCLVIVTFHQVDVLNAGEIISPFGGDISGGTGGFIADRSVLELAKNLGSSQLVSIQHGTMGIDILKTAGLTGKGRTVLVVDSGLAAGSQHRSKLIDFKDFVGSCNMSAPCDGYSHGTFVADIIGQIALETKMAVARVLDNSGRGKLENVVKAIDWGLKNRKKWNLKVINLSLGGQDDEFGSWNNAAELRKRLKEAYDYNISVVVSVGNENKSFIQIVPADSPFALTVGSIFNRFTVDRSDDVLSNFTNFGIINGSEVRHLNLHVGPMRIYERTETHHTKALVKPELLAPGELVCGEVEIGSFLHNVAKALTVLRQRGISKDTSEEVQIAYNYLSPMQKLKLVAQISIEDDSKKSFSDFLLSIPYQMVSENQMLASGTSFSGPGVAGGILLLDEYTKGDLTSAEMRELLIQTAEGPIRSVQEGIKADPAGMLLFLEDPHSVGAINFKAAFEKIGPHVQK